MRTVATRLAVCLAALGAPAALAAGPQHGPSPSGALTVSELPEVLSRTEVRPHLSTGLTTGLLLRLEGRAADGGPVRGAARVDVRWEPWDEVFHVTVVDGAGHLRREALGSFEALASWWSALEVIVAPAGVARVAAARLELQVMPFSQSEQRDAQRWFSSALAPETADDPQAGPGESRLNGVVDLLIATSIQRRSVVRFQWPSQPRPSRSGG